MLIDLERLDNTLREKICPSCVRFTSQGDCSLPEERPCTLFSNLEEIVNTVRGAHSKRIDPYVDLLRDQVCASCHFEDDHGSCPCRDQVDCALDTYYPLVVETIETELGDQSREQARSRQPDRD